jgi:hypothetical protein
VPSAYKNPKRLFKFSPKRLKGEILAPPIFNSGRLYLSFVAAGSRFALTCGYGNFAFRAFW